MDPYNVIFRGHKLDPYRVCQIFEVSHPAVQQIVKKGLRLGSKHKVTKEDLMDIKTSAERALEMIAEDDAWENQEFKYKQDDNTGRKSSIRSRASGDDEDRA